MFGKRFFVFLAMLLVLFMASTVMAKKVEDKKVIFHVAVGMFPLSYPGASSVSIGVNLFDAVYVESSIGTDLWNFFSDDQEMDISVAARGGIPFKILDKKERFRIYLTPKVGYRYRAHPSTPTLLFGPSCGDKYSDYEKSHGLSTVLGVDFTSKRKHRRIGFLAQLNGGITTRLGGKYKEVELVCSNYSETMEYVRTDRKRVYPEFRLALGITF